MARMPGWRAIVAVALVAAIWATSAAAAVAAMADQSCRPAGRTCDLPRVSDCCSPDPAPVAPVVTPVAEVTAAAAKAHFHATTWVADRVDLLPSVLPVVAPPGPPFNPSTAPGRTRNLVALLI